MAESGSPGRAPIPIAYDCPAADPLRSDAALWSIYDASFVPSEREPREAILSGVGTGVAIAVRARSAGETVGMGIVHLLRQPAAVFCVYIAISSPLRGQALGSGLFQRLCHVGTERLRADRVEPLGTIWEVDRIADATTPEEHNKRTRRIAFYERQGGRLLPARYVQPPVDGVTLVPQHLMFRPGAGGTFPDDATTAALISAIYFEKYGAVNRIPRTVLTSLLTSIGASAAGSAPS